MNSFIFFDTDFLSAFLKIERVGLVRNFYREEQIYVAPAVYRELAQTGLLLELDSIGWIDTMMPSANDFQRLIQNDAFERLGDGEQESIVLAISTSNSILLSNDRRAGQVAEELGANVVNIPAFLIACKSAGMLTIDEIRQIINLLWQRDRYRFHQEEEAFYFQGTPLKDKYILPF